MTTKPAVRKRILSGVQSSGKLHIGNYFGAVKQHIALQDQAQCFYFIADYHALTTIQDPKVLRDNTRDVALDYLALGLDPDKATFFRQSDVPEVCELTWILSTVTNMGLLERAVSYKEKVVKGIKTDSTPLGSPLNPDTCTVVALYGLFATDAEKAELAARYRAGSIGYGEAKKLLLAKLEAYFAPARERRKELAKDEAYVE